MPVKKAVADHYNDLSELLVESEITEEQAVRAAFGVDTIDNVFEAKDENYQSVAIIESNGFFYRILLPFDVVVGIIGKYRDVVRVE